MILKDPDNEIEVELRYEDGFPIVEIRLPDGSFQDENQRPTVEINLNNQTLHPMFKET